jgi:hypothetical protein
VESPYRARLRALIARAVADLPANADRGEVARAIDRTRCGNSSGWPQKLWLCERMIYLRQRFPAPPAPTPLFDLRAPPSRGFPGRPPPRQ